MQWAVGVITVPERHSSELPATLASLSSAGFQNVRLFVDGSCDSFPRDMQSTVRSPRVRAYGNWLLGLVELYVRSPNADRYAMFQDDIVCSRGMREYLEETTTHELAYWNCCTYPQNVDANVTGWMPAQTQIGLGAQALVFSNESVLQLLMQKRTFSRLRQKHFGHQAIDGAVITSLGSAGVVEMVHNPSLVLHVGRESTMGHPRQPDSYGFRGEEFDLMEFVR